MVPEVRFYKNVKCSLMQTFSAGIAAGMKGSLHWAAFMIQFFPLWRWYRCQLELSCCPAVVQLLWTGLPGWSPPGWSHSSLQEQCMTSEHGSILDGWCVLSSVSQLRGGEDTGISEILNDLSSDTIAHVVNTQWAAGGLPRDRRGKTSTPNDGIQELSVLLLRFYTQLPSTCGNILILKLQYSSPKSHTFTRCTLVIF